MTYHLIKVCTPLEILQALLFALPFVLTGFVHLAVIKKKLLPSLQNLPIDGGLKLRGRRLLGENKTVRGVVIVTGALVLWIYTQTIVLTYFSLTSLNLFEGSETSIFITGLLLGLGWIVGEFPNSFIKRQLDILPGAAAPGFKALVFWCADQIDSVLGVLVVAVIVLRLHPCHLVLISLIALVLHPLADVLMTAYGLKSRSQFFTLK